MTSSPTISLVSAALVKAQKEMSNAKKDATNPFFKKNYADINSVREAVLPALNTHGISVIQPTCVIEGVDYVETVLLHESGEFISSLTRIVVEKANDAQKHGSGLSYARRYALSSITNIGTEDDDANGATGKKVAPGMATFKPSDDQLAAANSLIRSSTLDSDKQQVAADGIINAKSQKEFDKLINRLKELQSNG